MKKNHKIILILSISFFLIVSLFLLFIIKEKMAQSKISLAQVEKKDYYAHGDIEDVLGEINDLVGSDSSEQREGDFEWRYRDGDELRSVNVAGVGMSFLGSPSVLMVVKDYFKEKGYIIDANNNISGTESGLYGYYKDRIACLFRFSAGSETDFTVDNLAHNAELHCGYLSEQDSIRLSPMEDDEKELSEEYEAVSIAKSYLAKLPEYINNKGGEIKVVNIKKNECPGCWLIEVSLKIDSLEKLGEKQDLQGVITMNDWAAVSNDINFPIAILPSIDSCLELGGYIASSSPVFICLENEKLLGKIGEGLDALFCCEEKSKEE